MSIPQNTLVPLYLPDGQYSCAIDLREFAAAVARQTVRRLEAEGRLLPAAPPCVVCGQAFTRSRADKKVCDNPACQAAKQTEYQRTYADKKAAKVAAILAAPAPACPDCGATQTYSKNRKGYFCKPCTSAKAGAASVAARVATGKIKAALIKAAPVAVQPAAVAIPAPTPVAAPPVAPYGVDFTAALEAKRNRTLFQLIHDSSHSERYIKDGVFVIERSSYKGNPTYRPKRFSSVDEYAEKAAVVTLDRAANIWRVNVPQEAAQ